LPSAIAQAALASNAVVSFAFCQPHNRGCGDRMPFSSLFLYFFNESGWRRCFVADYGRRLVQNLTVTGCSMLPVAE
jgi:hypothetical protein